MTESVAIPSHVAEVDRDWLCAAIPDIADARILDVIHGTATKIQAELDRRDGQGSFRVWVKSGMEPHSHTDGLEAVYAGEVIYYTRYADRYETRTPQCHFAASDAEGHSIIVLDDLLEQGATFVELPDAASPETIAKGLEYIARYQAASWLDAGLADDPWLKSGGSHNAYDLPKWLYTEERWRQYSALPRFRHLAPQLRDRAMLERAHRALLFDLFRREPWALCHGDSHYGQAYALPNGEVRLLDWQAVQIAHWSHDMAYFMGSGLDVADRRACETDLLRHYLGKLAEFGVAAPPDWDSAWRDYRMAILHGIGWTFCPPEMQPEENCAAICERFSAAVCDHDSVALIAANAARA